MPDGGMILSDWSSSATGGVLLALGAIVAWSLALYVVSRGGMRRIPLLTLAAVGSLVVFLTGQCVGIFQPEPALWIRWQQATWWGASVAPACWLLLAYAVLRAEAYASRTEALAPLIWALAGAAVVLGVAGSFTDTIHVWIATVTQPLGLVAPLGSLYPAYVAITTLCLLGALGCLLTLGALAPGNALRPRVGSLILAAVLFLGAGLYMVWPVTLAAWPGLPGDLLLICGLVLVGHATARYGALLAGEVVGADAVAFGVSMILIAGATGLAVLVIVPPGERWIGLPASLLLMTSHVAAAHRVALVDRLLFGRIPGGLRTELYALADRVVRQPDAQSALVTVMDDFSELVGSPTRLLTAARADDMPAGVAGEDAAAEFRVLVETALRRAGDLAALSRHPLLDRLPRTRDTALSPLERAAQLQVLLRDAVERLRPDGPQPSVGSRLPPAWQGYWALRGQYIDGLPQKTVMLRYDVGEGTFHRARRRALDAIAADLTAMTQQSGPLSSVQPSEMTAARSRSVSSGAVSPGSGTSGVPKTTRTP